MMTDPIADMLTRLRNGNAVRKAEVTMPASRMKVGVAQVLTEEGFIKGYSVEPTKPASTLTVQLKYGPNGEHVLRALDRVSKPGCRVYSGSKKLNQVLQGLGIYILSTPKGILSDRAARRENVGGEVLCKVN